MMKLSACFIFSVIANIVLAADDCSTRADEFVSQDPLWKFRKSQDHRFFCSFSQNEDWGQNPEEAWLRMCEEEADFQIRCLNAELDTEISKFVTSAFSNEKDAEGIEYKVVHIITVSR